MSAFLRNYSKHKTGILEYIRRNHPKKNQWDIYRNSWDELNGKLRYLLLETTSKCNLKCPMCIHSIGYPQVDDMDKNLFEIVLENIKNLKIPSIGMNQTNEPLLDKNIFSKIEKISNIDSVVDIMMNTNATLLDKKKSELLVNSGLHRLMVGFDAANEKTYKVVRGASYEKVKRNVLDFIETREKLNSKFPVLRVSFVRSSLNEHEVQDWISQWKEIADYVAVQEFWSPVLDGSKDFLYPSDAYRKSEASKRIPVCDQPFRQASIRGNGDVIACCNHQAVSMPIGNLFQENDLDKIYNGNSCKSLRKSLIDGTYVDNDVCRSCLAV